MTDETVVLVTGGSGYVASFCIGQLLNAGWTVRTTVRSLSREAQVRETLARLTPHGERLSVLAADLTSDAGWRVAAEGCQGVLHVASPLPLANPKSDDELVRPARDGALRVLAAARDAGVKRVVMTSSTAAVCYGRVGRARPFTEDDWSDPQGFKDSSAYERSKMIAERAAWDWLAAEGGGMELVAICPGAVLGPVLGEDFSASIDIVRKLMDGSLPGLPRFGWPLVDVRDIADLHVRALTSPVAAGKRYIGAGAFYWMSDIADVLRRDLPEARVPGMKLADWMVRLSAAFDPVVKERLFELGKLRPVSAERARTELGWSPRSPDATILDTARSLIAAGLVGR